MEHSYVYKAQVKFKTVPIEDTYYPQRPVLDSTIFSIYEKLFKIQSKISLILTFITLESQRSRFCIIHSFNPTFFATQTNI